MSQLRKRGSSHAPFQPAAHDGDARTLVPGVPLIALALALMPAADQRRRSGCLPPKRQLHLDHIAAGGNGPHFLRLLTHRRRVPLLIIAEPEEIVVDERARLLL